MPLWEAWDNVESEYVQVILDHGSALCKQYFNSTFFKYVPIGYHGSLKWLIVGILVIKTPSLKSLQWSGRHEMNSM